MSNIRLYLIFAFILFSAATLYVTSVLAQGKREGILQKRLEIFESQFQSVYSSYDKLTSLFYHEVIDDSDALEIFARASLTKDKDELSHIRSHLYNELRHTYEQLGQYNLRQLHFHLPNNDSFLRFHKPDLFGDNLTDIRTTVYLANKTKQRVTGFEEGRIYNGFRYVYPLSYKNRHIGTMESSLSFSALKKDIEKNLLGHVQFMIKKNIVDRKVFDSQKQFYILSDLNPAYYYETKALDTFNIPEFDKELIETINAKIAPAILHLMGENQNFSIDISVGRHTYIISFIAVPNVEGEKAAAYLIGYIQSDVLNAINQDYFFVAFTIIILSGTILLFVFYTIKRNEESKEEKRRFEAMFNQHTTIMLIIDPASQGQIIEANSAACQYYGYSYEELTQKHFHALCTEPKILLENGYNSMLKEESRIYNFKHNLKNHLITDVEVHTTIIPFQKQKFAYLIVYDITEKNLQKTQLINLNYALGERYQLEHEERKKLETYFSEITKNTFDAILSIDENGRVLTWNHACTKVLGFKEDEIIGKDLHKTIIPQGMYAEFTAGFRTFQESGMGPLVGKIIEVSAIHKNGYEVPVEVSINAVLVDDKYHAIGIIRDLSEKKQIEKERQQREKLLTQQSKMAEMGNMLNAIVHQWKQPLNAIMLLSQSIQEIIETEGKIAPNNPYFSDIETQIQFMSDTMNDFRNYFRPSKSKTLFSVKCSIQDLINMMHKHYEHSNVSLILKGDEQLKAFGYDNEFKQVILNLLNNARDAFVEQSRKDGTITMSITGDDNTITISIEDTAGGIPSELLPEKLFESYLSTKGDQGTGIGLSMSKTIIEDSMDGELSVYNTDKGACFIIRLPIKEVGHEEMPIGVLYVEDEEIARRVNSNFLKRHVKNLFVAEDGEIAYKLYLKNRDSIHLLITDYNMPHMDGLQLVEKIRQQDSTPKIIMMSAFKADLEYQVKEDVMVLEKPVRKDLLIKMVRIIHEELKIQEAPFSKTETNM